MKAFEKGSIALLEAMKLLWNRGLNAWLVMAGPSLSAFDEYLAANAKDCSRLVNLASLRRRRRTNSAGRGRYRGAALPGESLGLVVLEAWANGKPAIAADIGGVARIDEQHRRRLAGALRQQRAPCRRS